MPLVREPLACSGEYGVREPEVGGAIHTEYKLARVKSRTASAHAVCLSWKGGLRNVIAYLWASTL
jgi:hypothetical protein